MRSKKIIFLRHLASLGSFPSHISKIRDVRTGMPLFEQGDDKPSLEDLGLMVLQDVPGYLDIEWAPKEINYKSRTIVTQTTYVVDLDKYGNTDAYLEKHFGSKSRSALRRYKRRLEHCFTIKNKVYYGEVDKIEYDALFEQLRNLMISRFDQKKEQNYELRHLEGIKNDVYPKLLEKQASIFVIYANGRPISIRLNLMKGRLAFYLMSAYDPNYELFRVGKLDMWQNIHWLMENDYEKYDLLKGYGYIKDRWSDSKFDNNLVLFNGDDSLMGNFRFWFFYWKTKAPLALIGLGKRFGLDRVLRDWKQNKKSDNERNVFDISPLGSGEHATLHLGESVEFPTPDNELDREIIKLAYRHFHPVDGILVHKIEPGPQQYRIQLGEHAYLLKFKSNRGIG